MSYEIAKEAGILHLVDGAGELESVGKVTEFIRAQLAHAGTRRLGDVGLHYRVIGVFGGQSSGKSTLLNHIFGTKFRTMDEAAGRQQTTVGAYLSRSQIGENILVIDFEGTDGMERGEDQTFERQLSLFALSVADTLVINMWANEVGRFNAANLQLLRTVFEVNLQLFANIEETLAASASADPTSPAASRDKEKPTLLFVLRDTASSSHESLFDSLRKSLTKVWESVTKPKRFSESRMEDLFCLKFQAMSHYVYRREDFDGEVKQLQQSFVDSRSKNYLFSSTETFRGVPLEGLPQYLSSCWSAIKTSKDLNIPSQREMLAVVRCNELTKQYLSDFNAYAAEIYSKVKAGERIQRLSLILDEKIGELEEQFAHAARLYTSRIVLTHRRKLFSSMESQAAQLVKFQCTIIVSDELAKADGSVQRIVDDAIATLPVPLKDGGGGGIASSIRRAAPKLTGAQLEEYNKKKVDLFWTSIRDGIHATVDALQRQFGSGNVQSETATLLASDPRSLDVSMELLKEGVNKKVLSRFESMAADATTPMNKVFEAALNFDPSTKLQRTFRTRGAFEAAYTPAFHAGSLMLSCLFAARIELPTEGDRDVYLGVADGADVTGKPIYPTAAAERVTKTQLMRGDNLNALSTAESLDDSERPASPDEKATKAASHADPNAGIDVPSSTILLTESAVERAFELYQQQCRFAFKLQVHQIESGRGNVPGWVYVALVLLGWNEAWYVLTSPVLIILILLIAVIFFKELIRQQWAAFEESGPPQVVLPLKAAINIFKSYVPKGMLGEAPTDASPAASTRPARSETPEADKPQ